MDSGTSILARSWFAPGRTDERIRGWLKISRGIALRNRALLLFHELGEPAAAPEVLNLLDRRLNASDLDEAKAIAVTLCRLGANGEDRLRDVLMRLCLDPGESFLSRPLAAGANRPLQFQGQAKPDVGVMFEHAAAWERLDPAAAADWLEAIAPVLAGIPRKHAALPVSTLPLSAGQSSPHELEQELVFGVLERCLRRAPEAFHKIHSAFTVAVTPQITLRLAGLLTNPSVLLPQSPWPALRVEADDSLWRTSLIHKIPADGRDLVVGRLLELTRNDAPALVDQALGQIERLRGYAAGEHVAESLLELIDGSQGSIQRKAAATLVKVNNEGASPAAEDSMTRLLAERRKQSMPRPLSTPAPAPAGSPRERSYIQRLLEQLAATPEMNIEALRQAVDAASLHLVKRPPPPSFGVKADSVPLPETLARIENMAKTSADEQLVQECLLLLSTNAAVARWCGLRIAAFIGRDRWPAPVEPLLEPASKLLADPDEFVREQASGTLTALEKMVEINRYLADVESNMRALDRIAPSISKLEYARRLVPLLAVPPMRASAAPASAPQPQPVPPALGTTPSPGPRADTGSIIANLREGQRRAEGLAALRQMRDVESHPEFLPALAPIVFESQDLTDTPAPIFVSILEQNPDTSEAAAALDLIAVNLSSPVDSVRKTALSLVTGIASWAHSLAPRVVALIDDGNPAIRSQALQVLAAFGRDVIPEEMVQRLPVLLADNAINVRWAAANLVRALGERACGREVMSALRALVENPKMVFENRMHYRASHPDVIRTTAIQALGAMGAGAFEPAAGTLLNLLLDPDIETGITAARAAFAMGPEARGRVLEVLVAVAR